MKKSFNKCNANNNLMKTGFSIEIIESHNYDELELFSYQDVIDKLIYLAYNTRPDITFAVK